MTTGNYNPNDEQSVLAACERGFQSGGPRVYILDAFYKTLTPSQQNAKHTLAVASVGDVVLRRSKSGEKYIWKSARKAAT